MFYDMPKIAQSRKFYILLEISQGLSIKETINTNLQKLLKGTNSFGSKIFKGENSFGIQTFLLKIGKRQFQIYKTLE